MRRTWIPALAFVVALWAAGVNAQTSQGQAGTSGQTSTQGQSGTSGQSGTTGQTGTDQGGGTTAQPGTATSSAGAKTESDQQRFVNKAAINNMAEIQLSQLAVQRAQDPAVKQFAQTMVDEHTKALDQLKQVASSQGLQVPSDLDAKHQKMQSKLSNASGANFDKQYVKDMVAAHKQAASLLSKRAGKAGSEATSTSASSTGTSGATSGTTSGATGTSGTTGTTSGTATGTTGQETTGTTASAASAPASLDAWASTTLPTVRAHLKQAEDLQKNVKTEGGRTQQQK